MSLIFITYSSFKARLASKLKLAPEPIAFKKILSKSSSFLKIIHAGDYNDIEVMLKKRFLFVEFYIRLA